MRYIPLLLCVILAGCGKSSPDDKAQAPGQAPSPVQRPNQETVIKTWLHDHAHDPTGLEIIREFSRQTIQDKDGKTWTEVGIAVRVKNRMGTKVLNKLWFYFDKDNNLHEFVGDEYIDDRARQFEGKECDNVNCIRQTLDRRVLEAIHKQQDKLHKEVEAMQEKYKNGIP